jgi:hypothetical protein
MMFLPVDSSDEFLEADDVSLPRRLCTACEEYGSPTSRCHDEFLCFVCGHTYNKCSSLPGGLDSTLTECNNCRSKREFLEYRQLHIFLRSLGES